MIRFLLIALMLGAGQAAAQGTQPNQPQQSQAPTPPRTYSQADLWDRSGDRITFRLADISLPKRVGAVTFGEVSELGQPGRGLDNTIQFHSDDRAILASIYIYYPPIAHPGLSAFMTDRAMDLISEGRLRRLSAGTVPVGGVANGAIRMIYGGYQGRLASASAFVKVGRWMVKLRVSGPESRRADIEGTLDALLSSLRFEGAARPRATGLLDIAACTAPPVRDARAVNDPAIAFGTALLLPLDPLGEPDAQGRDGRPIDIVSRFGDQWCLSTVARYGREQTPILRAVRPDGNGSSGGGRAVALAMVSDSGTVLEVLRDDEHDTLVYHRIGESFVLSSYAGPPSDEQLVNVLNGADRDAQRIRATVALSPDGDSQITLTELPGSNGNRR
jgi:hypothetical protein